MHNCCRIPALQLTTIASDGPSCRGSWTSSNKPAAAAVHCTSRAARCRKPVPRRPRRASRRSCAGRVWARSSCGVSWCLSSVRVGAASAGPRRRHRHCINKNMVAVMLKNDRAANAVENRDISVSWISAFQQTFCEVKDWKSEAWSLVRVRGCYSQPNGHWWLGAQAQRSLVTRGICPQRFLLQLQQSLHTRPLLERSEELIFGDFLVDCNFVWFSTSFSAL